MKREPRILQAVFGGSRGCAVLRWRVQLLLRIGLVTIGLQCILACCKQVERSAGEEEVVPVGAAVAVEYQEDVQPIAITLHYTNYGYNEPDDYSVTVRKNGLVESDGVLSGARLNSRSMSLDQWEVARLYKFLKKSQLFEHPGMVKLGEGSHLGEATVTVEYANGVVSSVKHVAFHALSEPIELWVLVRLLERIGLIPEDCK